MIEYRIETSAKLSKIKSIWKRFLKNDQKWHYTLEGTYIELRVVKRMPALGAYLARKKWPYTTFTYSHHIPITRKYQKSFEEIFHGFAHLAMNVKREKSKEEDEKGDLRGVFERCIHLLCNLNGMDWRDEYRWVSQHALDRAYFTGYINAKEEESKKKKA